MLAFFGYGNDQEGQMMQQGQPMGMQQMQQEEMILQQGGMQPAGGERAGVRYMGTAEDFAAQQPSYATQAPQTLMQAPAGPMVSNIRTLQQAPATYSQSAFAVPAAPYPYSTYSVGPNQNGNNNEPVGPKKVVSERVISRDELFQTGNLVEAPTQKTTGPAEISPLMVDAQGGMPILPTMGGTMTMGVGIPGGSLRMNAMPGMPMAAGMPMPMGGSLTMNAMPAMSMAGGMPMPMGGSIQLSAAPAPMVPTVIMPGGGVPMGGSVRMNAVGPMNAPMVTVPMGGSFTAAPPPYGAMQRGGSFNAGPPAGFVPVPAGGSFTAAPMAPMMMQGGSVKMNAMPMGAMPMGQMGQMGGVPRPMGGSITMPVAAPQGQQIGVCGNEGCQKGGTNLCSACGTKAYCSVECQQKNWSQHKPDCKRIKAEREAAEQNQQTVAAPGAQPGNGFVRQLQTMPQQRPAPATMGFAPQQGPAGRISIPAYTSTAMMPPQGPAPMSMYGGGGYGGGGFAPGGSFTAAPPMMQQQPMMMQQPMTMQQPMMMQQQPMMGVTQPASRVERA